MTGCKWAGSDRPRIVPQRHETARKAPLSAEQAEVDPECHRRNYGPVTGLIRNGEGG